VEFARLATGAVPVNVVSNGVAVFERSVEEGSVEEGSVEEDRVEEEICGKELVEEGLVEFRVLEKGTEIAFDELGGNALASRPEVAANDERAGVPVPLEIMGIAVADCQPAVPEVVKSFV
jgi:hypothetical protein